MHSTVFLSTAYFPPIQYISKFFSFSEVHIEQFENYNKQSYRNRCHIYSANGILFLSVPVVTHPNNTTIRDILISYDMSWQKVHFKAIESAYKSSPFFIYYWDSFSHLFEVKHKYLFDLNCEILNILNSILKWSTTVFYSEKYLKADNFLFTDFRETIHPKPQKQTHDLNFKPHLYQQVFENKFGFISNLSVLDLLFNMGPDTAKILQNSII